MRMVRFSRTVWLAGMNVIVFLVGMSIAGSLLLVEPQTRSPNSTETQSDVLYQSPIETRTLLESPLFQRDRKPVDETAEGQIDQNITPTSPPVLVGVIRTDGESLVLLEDQERKNWGLVRTGNDFNGWKVESIGNKSVTIEHGNESLEIHLNAEQSQASFPNMTP
jgi:hypothetical protein